MCYVQTLMAYAFFCINLQSHELYYAAEMELNALFKTFAVNCSMLYGGLNTVAAQLKLNHKWATEAGRIITPASVY